MPTCDQRVFQKLNKRWEKVVTLEIGHVRYFQTGISRIQFYMSALCYI